MILLRKNIHVIVISLILLVGLICVAHYVQKESYGTTIKFCKMSHAIVGWEKSMCNSDSECCSGSCEPNSALGGKKFCSSNSKQEDRAAEMNKNISARNQSLNYNTQDVNEWCNTDPDCKNSGRMKCIQNHCQPCRTSNQDCSINDDCCSRNCRNGICGEPSPSVKDLPYVSEHTLSQQVLIDNNFLAKYPNWPADSKPGKTIKEAILCYGSGDWEPCARDSQCQSNDCMMLQSGSNTIGRCKPGVDTNVVNPCTPAPVQVEETPVPGQRLNFAVCHDGLKKCYEKDYDFTKEFGVKSMDDMMTSEKKKGKSVRYYGTPRDFSYVHTKGKRVDGFIHPNQKANQIMVCHNEKKKCYDLTADLPQAGLQYNTLGDFLNKEKAAGKSMLNYTIPIGFKYYK